MTHFQSLKNHAARLTATALASITCCAQAVTPLPDVGALLRQTEQGLQLQTPPATVHRREAPPPAMVQLGQATVTVKRFVFAGNTLVSNEALQACVASYLNRPLNFNALQAAAAAVAQTYREAGWLVTAYLPKQEISSGEVTLQIIEAVLGKVSVQPPQPQRVPAQRLIQIFESHQAKGAPLQADRVDRALLLLDDLPGVMVNGNLQAGDSHSETDMVLNVVDEPGIQGDVSTDNYGTPSLGIARASLNTHLNSPLRWGDQLSLNALQSQGSAYTRLAYSVPLGDDGWRAQARGTHMSHHLIGDLEATQGHGNARTHGAELSYPLQRSQTSNLNLSVGYDIKQYENFDSTGLTSRYQARASSVALSGNRIDASASTNNFGLTWVSGNIDLSDAPAAYTSGILNGANTAGRYNRWTLNLSRLQPVTTNTAVWLAYAAQFADKNLDSSEKIYLEGPTGVRAYGGGATGLGGSEGQTFTAELRHNLNENWRLTEFYDYARARINLNNLKADGTGPITDVNNFQLKGFGFTLAWQSVKGIDLKATTARRIGKNPNPNATTGQDQDGTYKNPRYWLSATMAF